MLENRYSKNSYKYFDWERFFEGKPTLDEIQTAAKMAADWSTSPSGQIDGIEREGKKPSDLELLNADYSFSTAMLKGDLMTAEYYFNKIQERALELI